MRALVGLQAQAGALDDRRSPVVPGRGSSDRADRECTDRTLAIPRRPGLSIDPDHIIPGRPAGRRAGFKARDRIACMPV